MHGNVTSMLDSLESLQAVAALQGAANLARADGIATLHANAEFDEGQKLSRLAGAVADSGVVSDYSLSLDIRNTFCPLVQQPMYVPATIVTHRL